MLPIKLRLQNFKSHADTKVPFHRMHIASITGSNGAGKSTILDGIVYALFGPKGIGLGQRADTIVREGTTDAMVELTFTIAGGTYRIRRGRRILATSVSSLELAKRTQAITTLDDELLEDWVAMTKGTSDATQAAIEELLGGDAEMFRRTTYVGQGDHARFSSATPAERKATLTQALDLGRYPGWAQEARDAARAAAAEIPSLEQRADALEQSAARAVTVNLGALEREIEDATTARDDAQQELETANQAVGKLREGQAAGLAARKLADELEAEHRAAVQADTTQQQMVKAAEVEAGHLERLRAERPALVDTAPMTSLLEPAEAEANAKATRLQELRDQARDVLTKATARDAALQVAQTRQSAVEAAQAKLDAARARRRAIDDQEQPSCPTCEQAIEGAAHAATVAKLEAEVDARNTDLNDALTSAEEAVKTAQKLQDEIEPGQAERITEEGKLAATELEIARAAINTIRTDIANANTQNQEHHAYGARIATAEAAAKRLEELKAAAELTTAKAADLGKRAAEARSAAPTDGVDQELARIEQRQAIAKGLVAGATKRIDEAQQKLAEGKATLKAAESDRAAREDVLRQIRDAKAAQARWDVLTDAFGRDGIPQKVIRHARPQIEHDTNELLARFGAPYRLRMDLERETKTGIADALDLTILVDGQERPYDLLSGGEQYRTNIAIRIALARILANRAGTEQSTLILDEPDGLDAAGFSALAEIITALGQEFPLVLTVSHTNGLEAACDTNIHVEKTDAGSVTQIGVAA